MKKFVKYGVIPAAIVLFLLAVTVVVLPVMVNIQKFEPEIEAQLSRLAGRPVTIGSNLGLSFLPSLSISCSELQIGNPEGFQSDRFIKIGSFEAKVRVLPLFKKEVQISRFIIGGLEVNLEKRSDGKGNWEFTGANRPGEPQATTMSRLSGWTVPEGFAMTLFAITDGTVNLIDRRDHSQHRFGDLMLVLKNVTPKEPIAVEFKASVAGQLLAGEGQLGPLGQHPGQGAVPVELAVSLFKSVAGQVKGNLLNLLVNPGFDLQLHVPPFAARDRLLASHLLELPDGASGSAALQSVSLDLTAKGNKDHVEIGKGVVKVDDSIFKYTVKMHDFAHPNVDFAVTVDRFDLDRYLAFAVAGRKPDGPAEGDEIAGSGYSGWRKIQLKGAMKAGEVKAGGATIHDLDVHLRGTDGILRVDSSTFNLYQGHAETTLTVDLQKETPETSIDMKAQGLEVQPLLHDLLGKDFLSGTMDMDLRLQVAGNSAEAIKKAHYGEGSLTVRDGVLEGIDMVDARRNLAGKSAGSQTSTQERRTEFAELKSHFTIRNGLVDSRETTLSSTLTDRLISGTVDLVGEQLQLLVKTKEGAAMPESLDNDKAVPESPVPFAISGPFAGPEIHIEAQYLAAKGESPAGGQIKQDSVEEELPASGKIEERDLLGKPSIDPADIARRFGLQRDEVKKGEVKQQPEKPKKAGTGKIHNPLREEEAGQ